MCLLWNNSLQGLSKFPHYIKGCFSFPYHLSALNEVFLILVTHVRMPFPPSQLLDEGRHSPAVTAWAASGSGTDAGVSGGLPEVGVASRTAMTCKCTWHSPPPLMREALMVQELPVPLPLQCQGNEAFTLQDRGKSQGGMTVLLAWAKLL